MPDEERSPLQTVPWGYRTKSSLCAGRKSTFFYTQSRGGGTGQRARSVPDKDHSPLHTIPLGELDEEHSPLTALHTIHLGCRTKITLPYTQSIWGAGQKSRSLTHNPFGVPDKEHSVLHTNPLGCRTKRTLFYTQSLRGAGQRALSSTQNPGGCRTDSTLHNHSRCRSESTPIYIHSRGGAGQTPCFSAHNPVRVPDRHHASLHTIPWGCRTDTMLLCTQSRGGAGQTPCFSAHNPVRVPDKEHAALNSSDCHDWSTRRFCTKGQVVSQGYASSRCWDLQCGQMSERKRQQLPSCA